MITLGEHQYRPLACEERKRVVVEMARTGDLAGNLELRVTLAEVWHLRKLEALRAAVFRSMTRAWRENRPQLALA